MLRRLALQNLVIFGIIFAQLFFVLFEFILTQSIDGAENVKGNVVNSKYVAITDHRYQHGDISDVIIGTVRNNSTQEIPTIYVTAMLYDNDNNLITTTTGLADASDLPEGDNSTFSVNFVLRENVANHYTLYAGGIPQLP
jgi:hypothetical protein